MAKEQGIRRGSIEELRPDPANANRGNERGAALLDYSIDAFGAGRSLLADKNLVVMAGNKTLEQLADKGITDAIFVQTKGNEVVVVVREDMDMLADPRAREMALADNRTAQLNITYEPLILAQMANDGVDLSKYFYDNEKEKLFAPLGQPDFEMEDAAGIGFGAGAAIDAPETEHHVRMVQLYFTPEQHARYVAVTGKIRKHVGDAAMTGTDAVMYVLDGWEPPDA